MILNYFCRVLNGYVAGGIPDNLEQGTVLSYNCDPGYQLVKEDTAVCSSKGKLSILSITKIFWF